MTNKFKKLSQKSFLKLHRTIKRLDHLKKCNLMEKELFFKNKEIKFLFEELLDEIDSENIKEQYRKYPDNVKKDLVWNHQVNLDKNSFQCLNIEYKNKHILKELSNLYQILTLNCICIIKRFELEKGIYKLLQILVECMKNNCRDKEIIMSTLKCLKSFGNNNYGITRLYENENVCEVLCKIICKSHDEECIIALDLLSVICLINRYACNKIIACFSKLNKSQHKDRFQPLIVCLMNQNKTAIQRSVMYFINTLLHSTKNASDHSVQFRLQLRKELYQLGFETYLNAYRQSDDKILCHQADIFLNKSHIDREEENFEFLKLQNELSTLHQCHIEWDKIIHNSKYYESSIIRLMQLLIFFLNRDKTNCDEIIRYLNKKLGSSLNYTNRFVSEEILTDQFHLISLTDCTSFNDCNLNEDEEIDFLQLPKAQKNKVCVSMSDLDSITSEFPTSNRSTPDNIKDSGLSQNFDKNHSSLCSISETESCTNSMELEDITVLDGKQVSDFNLITGSSTTMAKPSDQSFRISSHSSPIKNKQRTGDESPIILESYSGAIKFEDNDFQSTDKNETEQFSFSSNGTETLKNISTCISTSPCYAYPPASSAVVSTVLTSCFPSLSPIKATNKVIPPCTFLPPPPCTFLPPPPPCTFLPPPPPCTFLPPPPPPLPTSSFNQVISFMKPDSTSKPLNARESVKKINVTLIPEKNVNKNSIWLQMKNDNYENDIFFEKLLSRFSNKKTVEIKKKIAKPLIVMDEKKGQNFEIFLRSINMRNDILIKAIKEMDVKSINLDMIGKFIDFVPDQNQLKKLEPYKEKVENLRTCEQFLISLMEVENYKIRLHGIHLQILISNKCLTDAENSLSLVNETFDKLLSSNRFKTVLEMILLLTRAMTPNKKIVGISIDSLSKLIDTKDNSNGNLLHFFIEQLQELKPDSLNTWKDLDTLDAASCISQESINSIVNQFASCLKTVQTDIEEIESVYLRTEIIANVELAKFLLLETKQLQNSVQIKYQQICEYLSITKPNYNYENLFADLKTFKQQFNQALKQISERKELDTIHKQKLESINKLQKQQLKRSDQLATMLSSFVADSEEINRSKYLIKPDSLIDNTIIGISSGKIFCDEEAILNWNIQLHRKENHRHRADNIRNVRRHPLNKLTPSRTREIDVNQIIGSEKLFS